MEGSGVQEYEREPLLSIIWSGFGHVISSKPFVQKQNKTKQTQPAYWRFKFKFFNLKLLKTEARTDWNTELLLSLYHRIPASLLIHHLPSRAWLFSKPSTPSKADPLGFAGSPGPHPSASVRCLTTEHQPRLLAGLHFLQQYNHGNHSD